MTKLHMLGLVKDEHGGGTVMGLMWFMVIVGICGLAVDSTDSLRTQTGLQSTADATALAATMDLPNESLALGKALLYSELNMPIAINGNVLTTGDVEFGTWDPLTRTFTPGGAVPLATRVELHRSRTNGNALASNFLRITGMDAWEDIAAAAVAERFIPECLKDGLLAEGEVDMSSGNGFVNEICIYGKLGVDMQQANSFQEGVTVMMPDPSTQLTTPGGELASNPGLAAALRAGTQQLRMIGDLPNIIRKLKDPSLDVVYPPVIPSFINAMLPVIEERNNTIDFSTLDYTENNGRIYYIDCRGQPTVTVPPGTTLRNVAIVIECNLHFGANVTLENVVLASEKIGNGQDPLNHTNISFSASAQIGKDDNCDEGGGVQIYSPASVQISSSAIIDGLQIVTGGDIQLGAQDFGINGISAQAGGDITMSSSNIFGLCSGGAPQLFTVGYYHLVR